MGLGYALILVDFPGSVIKHSGKSSLKEKVFVLAHNSKIQSTIVGKLECLELDDANHTADTIRRRQQ